MSESILLITLILCATTGSISCVLLTEKQGWYVVKSSALSTLIFATLLQFIPATYELPTDLLLSAFFGGSFVGMSKSETLPLWGIGIASIHFAIFFHYTYTHFNGVGGALGTSACLSVIVVYLLSKFVSIVSVKKQQAS